MATFQEYLFQRMDIAVQPKKLTHVYASMVFFKILKSSFVCLKEQLSSYHPPAHHQIIECRAPTQVPIDREGK